jgi:hypothetical protein
MISAIGCKWRIASHGHTKTPVDLEGYIQSRRWFLQIVWQLLHVEFMIWLNNNINGWIQSILDYNLNVYILLMILARWFGQIRPQDRAMRPENDPPFLSMTLSKWAQNLFALHTTTTQHKRWIDTSTDQQWPNKTMLPAQKLIHIIYRSIYNQPIGCIHYCIKVDYLANCHTITSI